LWFLSNVFGQFNTKSFLYKPFSLAMIRWEAERFQWSHKEIDLELVPTQVVKQNFLIFPKPPVIKGRLTDWLNLIRWTLPRGTIKSQNSSSLSLNFFTYLGSTSPNSWQNHINEFNYTSPLEQTYTCTIHHKSTQPKTRLLTVTKHPLCL